RADNRLRFGSIVSSPRPASGSPMTPWTTTSLPSSSTPAASQPRTLGNSSARRPPPRRLQTSCWFNAAAFTCTRAQPSGGNGFRTSPTLRPVSGSLESKDVTLTASMKPTVRRPQAGTRRRRAARHQLSYPDLYRLAPGRHLTCWKDAPSMMCVRSGDPRPDIAGTRSRIGCRKAGHYLEDLLTALRLRPRTQAAGVVAIATVLALSGCASKKSTTATSPTSAAPSAAASAAPSTAAAPSAAASSAADPASLLPAAIKTAGALNIAPDASYAPNEYFDTDGKTIIGLDVDLGNAIAAKLGLKANFQNVTFAAIIPALAASKYDLSLSSFTDTKAREATVDFVDYFNAGESLMVLAGNPKGVTGPDLSLCGLTIAVEKGTTEESEI